MDIVIHAFHKVKHISPLSQVHAR